MREEQAAAGGPAFPVADYDHQTFAPKTLEENRRLRSGMSLRDYFAAHEPMDPNESIGLKLAERLTGRTHPSPKDEKGQFTVGADPVDVAIFWADAEAAYRYLRADAMLRARATGEPKA